MTFDPDTHLQQVLARETVDTRANSPVLRAANSLVPVLQRWAGTQLVAVRPSGSWAKGTANCSGTDIDLFISLAANTTNTLKEIYDSLFKALSQADYQPKRQNVSIGVRTAGVDVDLVPGRRQNDHDTDHSLYRRKADTWTKTNVDTHIALVRGSGITSAIRVLKLWRNQWGLDFPSFYLELAAINAVQGAHLALPMQVTQCLAYLRDNFENALVIDPANTSNIISADLTAAEKRKIAM